MTLNATQMSELMQADRGPVVNALSNLVLNNVTWLPTGHAAASGIDKSRHKSDGTCPITEIQLAEYLAIATPTHLADGWSYLSRALNSYFLGDAHSAWHFAYYAELRAAQSILSASGCGAFNGWNCILDNSGSIKHVGKDLTHQIVWQALEGLTDVSAGASSDIARATSCFGHSLPELVQFAYSGISPSATSSNWINDWIFDLRISAEDKDFRNRCSYEPHVVTPHHAHLSDAVETIITLWQSLEPTPTAFLEIDKELIKVALEKAAKNSRKLSLVRDPTADEVTAELRLAYGRIVASAPTFQVVSESFITRVGSINPILTHAKNRDPAPRTPQPVIARATLLLRIATGVAQNLLRDAGRLNDIAFWLDDLAERQGIVIARDQIPEDRCELHNVCFNAAEDLEHQFSNGNNNLGLLFEQADIKPHLFSQLERVVQWSFLP